MRIKVPEAFRFLWQPKADDGSQVRYRAAHGGRGSAKSHSFAQALVLKAAERPLRILCAREVQKSIRDSVKRLLDDKVEASGLRGFFESTDTEIRGRNGSLFIFAGLRSNPAAVKSSEGLDIAAVFEASPVSVRSWELLTPTIRNDPVFGADGSLIRPGSEIWAEWNPDSATDPVDVMFRGPDGAPPGSIVRQVNWDENPFFPNVLRREMEWDRKRDPDKWQHVWQGGYVANSESRVFKNWRIDDFDADPAWILRQGADWGFSVDPSVLVQCAIVGRTLYVIHEAYQVGCEIDYMPELFRSVPESERWPTTADSSRPETISHMRRHGFPKMLAAVKGARSVEEGVEFLKSYDIVVHPRCVRTIAELQAYRYETDDLTGAVLPKLKDKDNHVIDALRYACEGARRSIRANAQQISAVTPLPMVSPFRR